jgi:hypothetical protein
MGGMIPHLAGRGEALSRFPGDRRIPDPAPPFTELGYDSAPWLHFQD